MKLQHQKWNESDFEFVLEDMAAGTERIWQIEGGRVLDKPKRRRSVPVGETTKSYVICFHGRLLAQSCGACGFEAPRLIQADAESASRSTPT